MGCWGTGNLDSDAGMDYQYFFLLGIVKDITFSLSPPNHRRFKHAAFEIMAAIDILIQIIEHYDYYLDDLEEHGKNWRSVYLDLYDNSELLMFADGKFTPADTRHKALRREVIVRTFDKLSVIMDRYKAAWDEYYKEQRDRES
jgi:hypothetical protein